MSLPNFISNRQFRLAALSMISGLCAVGCTPNSAARLSGLEAAAQAGQAMISAQGRLLPKGGIVQISAIPGDRIESIEVSVRDDVKAHQVLVKMRSEQLRKGELDAANARLKEARNAINAKKKEAEFAVSTARNRHLQAQSAHQQALEQLKLVQAQADASPESQSSAMKRQLDAMLAIRSNPLTRMMVGSLELDARRAEFKKLEATLQSSLLTANQAVETTKLAVQLAEEGIQTAKESLTLIEASSPIKSLQKQIEVVESQIKQSTITAPFNGTILTSLSEAGELSSGFPILEMADLSQMVCVAEVHEADVGSLKLGNVVQISSAGLKRTIQGKVLRIDSIVGIPQMRSPNPMARTDYRAIPVIVEIDPEFTKLAADRVQLQVDVRIARESQ
jgi:HlyD family secretion protein